MHSVFDGLTMAAPMSHNTIKFDSNIFNTLRLLVTTAPKTVNLKLGDLLKVDNLKR